jgi:hypothetical protein
MVMKRTAFTSMLVLLLLVPLVSLNAQARREIIRAEYGAGNTWSDVTNHIHMLVSSGQQNLLVNTATIGTDPLPGTPKMLRLQVRMPNGNIRQMVFYDNDRVNLRPYVVRYSTSTRFQILSATYGAGNRAVDVTQRLNSAVRNGQLSLQVSNETMGSDPSYGDLKTLTVAYRHNGQTYREVFREGEYVNLPLGGAYTTSRGERLFITRAEYGVGDRKMDVTDRLNTSIRNGELNLRVANDTMGGDPAPNRLKQLTVWFTHNGRSERVTVSEGNYLVLPYGTTRYDSEEQLEITRAQYGTDYRAMDVTDRLNATIRNGQLSLRVSNQTMGGDPAYNQIKELTVWYRYNGRTNQITVNEGGYLSLPLPEERQAALYR